MALVSYVSNQEAAEKIKPVFEGMEKKFGAVPNVFRAMAHNPEMLEAFLALNATLPKTKLDGKLRELAYIKTSELNGCDYCLHHHRGLGKKAGLNDRQVARDRPVRDQRRLRRPRARSDALCRRSDPAHQRRRRRLRPAQAAARRPRDGRARHDRRHRQLHQPRHRDPEAGAAMSESAIGEWRGSLRWVPLAPARAAGPRRDGREGQDDP